MTIQQLPQTKESIDIRYLSSFGIQGYDSDNRYPQNVLRILARSKTGTGCLERYKDFIEGDGIKDPLFAAMVVNCSGETLDDIHGLCASDMATFNGAALHVNYDVFGRIVGMQQIPFESVRLLEPDEEGVVKKVAIHPDWTGKRTRNGKKLAITKDTIDFIDVFNPDPAVVKRQIEEAGGIQFYKGQVLYISAAGNLRYPLAIYDSVLPDMSTDEGISNIMLRNVRNGFMPAGVFVHYKGQQNPDGLSSEDDTTRDEPEYSEELATLQGDTNALKILDLTLESEEDVPKFMDLSGHNYDKEFTVTEQSIVDNIYARFGQEAFLSLRRGKVGFSGQLIADATNDYARRCTKVQRRLSRAYMQVLRAWDPDALPGTLPATDLEISPITASLTNTAE